MISHIPRGGKISFICIVWPFAKIVTGYGFGDKEVQVCVALAVRVRYHVYRDAIYRNIHIRTVVGIKAAQKAGLAVKINAVALQGINETEFESLICWAHGDGMDLTFIEVMPLGEVEGQRADQYIPLSKVRADLLDSFTLTDIAYKTGGPARYVEVKETGGRLGFITPLTHNFCESCNRVRVTCTGTLYMCLGQEDAADLRRPLRASTTDEALFAAMEAAIARKPKGHDFIIDRTTKNPAVGRHMSVTGG